MTFDLDDILAKAAPRTKEVRVCLNPGLVTAHEAAVLRLQEALHREQHEGDLTGGSDDMRSAAEEVARIEAEMEEASHTFVLRSVSRRRWQDLIAAHPPTPEQRRAGNEADPDRFPVAAVAACLVEPQLTEDQVRRLAESDAMTFGEWLKLWHAVMALNVPPVPAPKLGAATELLRLSGGSSTTSALEDSPDHGSLAGSGKPSPNTTTTPPDA